MNSFCAGRGSDMRKIVNEEMKKIFKRPVIQVTLIFFLLAALYSAAFIPSGKSYYYDGKHDRFVEVSTSLDIKRDYAHQIKGIITSEELERYYNEYLIIMNNISNYGDEINLQEEKDRRYELWAYKPIEHLFQLYYSRNDYHILRQLLSDGVLFDWCGGYVHAIDLANSIFSIFIGLLIILGVSTIFSEE